VPGILVAKPKAGTGAWRDFQEDVLPPGSNGQLVVVDSTQASGFNLADAPVIPTVPSFSDAEVPTDSGDHQHFTLAHSPNPTASLILVLNGLVQNPGAGNDYTLSGAAITLAAALSVTFALLAWYRY